MLSGGITLSGEKKGGVEVGGGGRGGGASNVCASNTSVCTHDVGSDWDPDDLLVVVRETVRPYGSVLLSRVRKSESLESPNPKKKPK